MKLLRNLYSGCLLSPLLHVICTFIWFESIIATTFFNPALFFYVIFYFFPTIHLLHHFFYSFFLHFSSSFYFLLSFIHFLSTYIIYLLILSTLSNSLFLNIFFPSNHAKLISFRCYMFILFIFDFDFFYIKKSPKIKFTFGDKTIYSSNSDLVLFNYFHLTAFHFHTLPILLPQLFFDNFEDTGGMILNTISFCLLRA